MRKLKILYMHGFWVHGGIEAYMLNVFDHIDHTQYDFEIALPGENRWPYEDSLSQRGINVIHYPASSLRQQIKEIKKILDFGDYDIVHVMLGYLAPEAYMIFAMVAIAEQRHHHYKVICHAHNAEDKTRAVNFAKKTVRGIIRNILRRKISNAALLAACSHEAGNFVYGSKRDVNVFYNGIDLDKFVSSNSCENVLDWYRKYGIDKEKINFVAVGRIDDQKNPLFTLDIIKALCRYYPNLRFTWVGAGTMRKNVESHIEELGIGDRVQLLGTQNYVEEILACCDYFLLPSKYEGLGIVFIEAQAAGLRCFTSDQVPKDADCGGVTFIPLDKTAEQWAEEIHRQIEAEPKANIDMERLSRFDINRTVKDLSEVYNRLVEQ